MYKIIRKSKLNDQMTMMVIEAPFVAKKALAGQFIMLRVNETGERIPLTVADYDREKGYVTIIFQKVGKTTMLLDSLDEGDSVLDLVGPLGKPTDHTGVKRAAVIGGGAGCAIAYPQAKAMKENGIYVDMIAGFRNSDLVILEDEMAAESNQLIIMTDDGSNGNKGFVTDALKNEIAAGKNYDFVIAIGPLPMMKAVCNLTKEYGIKTVISMNSYMIDGTGMCGCCRVTVDGKVKFACVDGPDFDGHLVDFDEAIKRSRIYAEQERKARDEHCNLMKAKVSDNG
ncbi:MAG: sulfide/dihydroorotate dehydrogenase-like FAD/NAD-binding protein [Clostridia bacterium]|nr:sulfide/dihydroorotate dehydrogenase-like FAD/NAD-binding protein [Clostridia bacterium]